MSSLPRPLKWPPIFPLDKDFVVWFPVDGRSGAKLHDRSGKGNHGTLSNVTWAAGRIGSALSFNGSTSKVTIADHDTLDVVTALTILMRIKTTITADYQRIVWKNAAYALTLKPTTGRAYGTSFVSGGYRDSTDSTTNVCDGTWHSLGYVHDTTQAASALKIYVDGKLESVRERAGSIGVSTDNLLIGQQGLNQYPFSGLMTEFLLVKRALGAVEMKRHAESEVLMVRY